MSERRTKRVLLLGWDAADWKVAQPLLDGGEMPHLQRLIERGVSGRIATLQPALSPMLWTSVATGKHGDQHGILGFLEPTPDGASLRTVTSTSRQTKAIWNILSQSGMTAIPLGWFASYPAEQIDGYVVTNHFTDIAPSDHPLLSAGCHPPDLLPVLEACRVRPAALTPAQMLPFFLEKLPADDDPRLQAVAQQIARCASLHNAATFLAENADWDLLAVYYDQIDHLGHGFMPYAPPRAPHISEEDFATYRHVIDSAYRYHDLMLGRWLELVGEDTTIILLSDHGFYSGESRPRANRGSLDAATSGFDPSPLSWHHPQGMFVMAGPGVRQDALVHEATLLDITPTILMLLGLPVADDMEGRPLFQTLTDATPPARIASYEPPHPDDGVWRDVPTEEQDPWAANEAIRQLAELGYVSLESDAATQVQNAVEGRDSNLAQVLSSKGRYEETLVILRRLLALRPTEIVLRCREVMCLLALRRHDEAETAVLTTLEMAPDSALAHLLLGEVRVLQGRLDEAHAILDRVGRAEAEMPLVHLQLGMVYLRQQRWTDAEAIYRKWLVHDPDSADAHDGLGVALRETGRTEEAIYEHMQSISLRHDRAQTHVNLGISLGIHRQYDWAIRAFTVATELAPDEPFPHRCLARLYFSAKKDRAQASWHAEKMLELRRLARERGQTPKFSTGA